jgi:hypothetical protein
MGIEIEAQGQVRFLFWIKANYGSIAVFSI